MIVENSFNKICKDSRKSVNKWCLRNRFLGIVFEKLCFEKSFFRNCVLRNCVLRNRFLGIVFLELCLRNRVYELKK